MSASSATLAGRRFAEEQMLDTASITHPAGATKHHQGKCLVRPAGTAGRLDFEQGDATQRSVVFPHDVVATVGDIVEITASADVTLVGERLRVVARPSQTFVMYREYSCEVIG